ncbi:hypothetical protein [Streptomyces sp. NPDC055105]|uniref:hypothetical protein n=1 Tax=Streptomyces sp. NPDC055105 TaxID=3365719 RepID=UPI0037D3AD1A
MSKNRSVSERSRFHPHTFDEIPNVPETAASVGAKRTMLHAGGKFDGLDGAHHHDRRCGGRMFSPLPMTFL